MKEIIELILLVFAMFIGVIIGYQIEKSNMEEEAIKQGVARYVLTEPLINTATFQWITPTNMPPSH